MRVHLPVIPAVALAVSMLIVPSAAIACSIAGGPTNARPVSPSQVVAPERESSMRSDWGVHASWRSIRPDLAGTVRVAGGSKDGRGGAARRSQRALSFIGMNGFGARRWYDDEEPATTCSRRGEQVYTQPRLVVRETARAIHVTFLIRRTAPDPVGCVSWSPKDPPLPGNQQVVLGSCDDVAYGRVVLTRPVGERRIVLDWFPS